MSEILTIAHEAHTRLELWLALSARNYRHASSLADNTDRKKKWLKMAALVMKDREDNADAAHVLRTKDLPFIPEDDQDNAEEGTLAGRGFYK